MQACHGGPSATSETRAGATVKSTRAPQRARRRGTPTSRTDGARGARTAFASGAHPAQPAQRNSSAAPGGRGTAAQTQQRAWCRTCGLARSPLRATTSNLAKSAWHTNKEPPRRAGARQHRAARAAACMSHVSRPPQGCWGTTRSCRRGGSGRRNMRVPFLLLSNTSQRTVLSGMQTDDQGERDRGRARHADRERERERETWRLRGVVGRPQQVRSSVPRWLGGRASRGVRRKRARARAQRQCGKSVQRRPRSPLRGGVCGRVKGKEQLRARAALLCHWGCRQR